MRNKNFLFLFFVLSLCLMGCNNRAINYKKIGGSVVADRGNEYGNTQLYDANYKNLTKKNTILDYETLKKAVYYKEKDNTSWRFIVLNTDLEGKWDSRFTLPIDDTSYYCQWGENPETSTEEVEWLNNSMFDYSDDLGKGRALTEELLHNKLDKKESGKSFKTVGECVNIVNSDENERICDNYGYKDWFIPSLSEMNLIAKCSGLGEYWYKNKESKTEDNFCFLGDNSAYWTSTLENGNVWSFCGYCWGEYNNPWKTTLPGSGGMRFLLIRTI